MKAKILDTSEKSHWDEFVKKHPLSSIHQTSIWGHFQEKIPSRGKSWIIVLEENDKIIGGTILIRQKLPKGYSWLYAARGPLLDYKENTQKQLDTLLEKIKTIAKEEKSIFLRIDPPIRLEKSQKTPQFKKFHITHSGFQPEHTLILNLENSEETLLKNMKPKGRYNIRLAEKRGVEVHLANPHDKEQFNKDIEDFYEILTQTTERDGFHGHDKEFYENMLLTLTPQKCELATFLCAKLYLAKYEEKAIAGTIVTFFKDTAIYYYGASGDKHRNTMAPYLLQWTAIKDAKAMNCKYYDFLGIAPADAKNHPWCGVTEFKKKFGGEEVSYAPPQEFPFKKLLYLLYRLYKKIR